MARRKKSDETTPEAQVADLSRQLDEVLSQQRATAEILRAIASAPGNADHALQTILETTARLFGCSGVDIRERDGEILRAIASSGPGGRDVTARLPQVAVDAKTLPGAVIVEGRQIHIPDVENPEPRMADWPGLPVILKAGTRTVACTPLKREGKVMGVMTVHRNALRPFTESELAQLSNFADQAVIAIENARLLSELRESLERQTATAEILRAIASAPGDAHRVLQTIMDTTARLFGCAGVHVRLLEGDQLRLAASSGDTSRAIVERFPEISIERDSPQGAAVLEARQFHVDDVDRPDPPFDRWYGLQTAREAGIRTVASTPLMREGRVIGVLSTERDEHRPFSEYELAQLVNFADQAVIAIENARLLSELRESLENQTATAEVLSTIAASPAEAGKALDTIAQVTADLFNASGAVIRIVEGDRLRLGGSSGRAGERLRADLGEQIPLTEDTLPGATVLRRSQIHIPDVENVGPEIAHWPGIASQRASGTRAVVGTPLMRGGQAIGALMIQRGEPQPFTDKELAQLRNFADQAVIAIENARLLNELRDRTDELTESLEQQTAMSDVLEVISASPSDVAPVFEAILTNATQVCGANFGHLDLYDGANFRIAAQRGAPPALVEWIEANTDSWPSPMPQNLREPAHVIDYREYPAYAIERNPLSVAMAALGGARTFLRVPLLREGELIGVFALFRTEVRPFTDKQIALVKNFADQAVIAIENARLLNELRDSLDRQTASAEVLQIISSSPGDLEPVFNAMLVNALRICDAQQGQLMRCEGDHFVTWADINVPPAFAEFARGRLQAGPETGLGRARSTKKTVHIGDLKAEPIYQQGDAVRRAAVDKGKARTSLFVPLLKGDDVIGIFVMFRYDVRPFEDKQIQQVENFADQAVIAIENARLLSELRESLDRRTAIAEVLQVISSTPGELTPVFDAMLDKAVRLCGVSEGSVFSVTGDVLHRVATRGSSDHLAADYEHVNVVPGSPPGRMLSDRKTIHVHDMSEMLVNMAEKRELPGMAAARALADRGVRTALWVPMVRDEVVVGAFVLHRREVRPFSEAQIGLVENFANQAVIAIENARLLSEIRNARDSAERALGELQAAQASLVQAEKMASLGQLTAGIAHEIKNPLNFVNNFAVLSVELLDEIKELTAPAMQNLDETARGEVDELMEMLTGNLEKVAEHGKRADGIVRSMLAHSRGSSGDRQVVNLNELLDESLNLAYHGARALDQNFNITMEREFDPSLAPIEVVPQDLTRVFLNLFSNGFYAANKRRGEIGDAAFQPTLKVTTEEHGSDVLIRIRDNGVGIPPGMRQKLFEPFFTTKPTGEGTGLGLSISYEIVTKLHGGAIEVESEPGAFTEFRISLPKSAGIARD